MRIDTNAVNYFNSMNAMRTSNSAAALSSVRAAAKYNSKSESFEKTIKTDEVPGAADFSMKMDSKKVYLSNHYGDTAEISRELMDIDRTLSMLGISNDNVFQVNKRVDGSLNVRGGSPAEAMRLERYLNA